MKTIRIFIASSSELKEDRELFRNFISNENDRLHEKGIYLMVVQWENFFDAISETRLQDDYNDAIRECDVVFCLFFTKVGKFTAEEFDAAHQAFKDTGEPKIWTYFKNADLKSSSITKEFNTVLAFKEKIGNLGHFHTEYTSNDNLHLQFRNQLDKFLSLSEEDPLEDSGNNENKFEVVITKPKTNTFNILLTKRLIEAISPYNKKVKELLDMNSDWENKANLVPAVKRMIISNYVGVLGMQLRKLMSIGEEDFSESKMKRYLENCQLTATRALQLLCFALISKLWDHRNHMKIELSEIQTTTITKFFMNAAEENIIGFADLLRIMIGIFIDNKLKLPIPYLNDLQPKLQDDGSFWEACTQLNKIHELLNNATFSDKDCNEAEKNLAHVLESLSFLAEYRMISIKDIDYDQQRNDTEGLYLHNYTLIEGDSHTNNSRQGKIRMDSTPVISYAVLLFKDDYRENINMVPFIIDYNGLADAGGSKICFYSFCNSFDDLSLNYNFIEDNSKVTVKKSNNPKPDDNSSDINTWLAKKENRKDLNLDNIFTFFYQAKKTLTGIEEENDGDKF